MASDTPSKSLNPDTPEFSPPQIPSPKTNANEISMSISRSHSCSNSAPTPTHVNVKNKGFSFPYTYQGTTYYTRPPPPLPPPLPYEGWIPFYPMNHNMDNGYNIAQSNGYSHHHGNGYVHPFSTSYSSPHHNGYNAAHYNHNFHQHFYNYNCSNNFPLHTPYTNGNANPDLSTPFTTQLSQVHGIRSGLLCQQNTLTRPNNLVSDNRQAGNGEWKKRKKNKRNKRKKYNKNKGNNNDEPAHSGDEADVSDGVLDEANSNEFHQNGESDHVYTDDKKVHDNGDVDGQTVSDDEVQSQVDSGVSVRQNGHIDTQFKTSGKTDSSFDEFENDPFYEYREMQRRVNGMSNGKGYLRTNGNGNTDAEGHGE